ncbi:MAG: hypothetical protein JWL60_993 [Gemmatimonadetes bacterium]|jgi:Tfp pilus assembly protein PilV|nr:hypothetical protein [Gemmatimonadota bacterium]
MTTRPAHRPRTGISLVEVITALVLVAVGLMGIAGSSALMLRRATEHDLARRATRSAARRLALLSSAGCSGARSGAVGSTPAGVVERWTVTVTPARAARLEVVVEWPERAARRSLVIRSAILC